MTRSAWSVIRPHRLSRLSVLCAGVVLLVGAGLASPARGATFTVTKEADTADGVCDADCSLREAVIAANSLAGPDVIELPNGLYLLTIAGAGEGAAATGDLDISEALEVRGADPRRTVIDGGGLDRVFHAVAPVIVTFADLQIRNGAAPGGGAIAGSGDLTLERCILADNIATGAVFGGALAWGNPGSLTISDSTFSGNTAGGGGGAINHATPLTLTNSTFSDNESTGDFGGAIYAFSEASAEIRNSTFTNNRATLGGAILAESLAVTVSRTVIAGNTAPSSPDCQGSFVSEGFNLVGDGSACSGFSATGDQVGTSGSPIEPLLNPLENNSGPTDTHLPRTGSPLLDAGDPVAPLAGLPPCPATDQRGAARPFDGDGDMIAVCDIGAVEGGALLLFRDGFETGNTSEWSGSVGE